MKKAAKLFKTLCLSALSGIILAAAVGLYKFCAHHIIHFSEKGFALIRDNLWISPFVIAFLFLISLALAKIFKRRENLKGGGIPNAVLAAKGKKSLSPFLDTVGMFFLSLLSFLLGVPLGNEGPCVQMGAALSSGVSKISHNDEDIKKECVAAGACAGFAAATGAPIAGVAFLFDEISRRPKLRVLAGAAVSALSCGIVLKSICPILGVEAALLPRLALPAFSVNGIWIAAAVGIVFSVIAIGFLKLYKLLWKLYNNAFKKVETQYKIFFVLALSLAAGIISGDFISTGHSLSLELFSSGKALTMLLAILLVRSFLTLSANVNGLCGGTFVPIIAIGAVVAAGLGAGAAAIFGAEYYQLVMLLSITACIAGMMKMPMVSVFFALEILCPIEYIPCVVIAAAAAYLPVELLKVKSINEIIIEKK